MKGTAFERLRFRHPFIDRDSPGRAGRLRHHATRAPGVVHTAPGHGCDDYLTGVRYGLDIYCPVDEAGRFLPEVEHFAGKKVFDANPEIVDLPEGAGVLVASGTNVHSYPICWRCKNPIIFRATEQWFIALDGEDGLRERALEAIAKVQWFPAWGEERIRNMIATRPDWCISRQRLWGVPIPAFYCKGCAKPVLRADLCRHVADIFEKESADAWYEREAKDLLPAGLHLRRAAAATEFDKEKDILDVWFDSGSSHAAVLGHRPDLPWPADVYLEGSDQHRGWFHSSLLIGVATRGQAPYRQVVTHGFTVDAAGKKISKSVGNDVDTQKLIADLRGRDPAPVDDHGRLPRGHALLRRDPEAGGRGLPQGAQHLALPALQPLRLRSREGRGGRRPPSTSSTASPWTGTARWWPGCARPTTPTSSTWSTTPSPSTRPPTSRPSTSTC